MKCKKCRILAITLLVTLSSCSFNELEVTDIATVEFLNVFLENATFDEDNSQFTCKIEARNCHWNIIGIPSWLHVSENEGDGDKNVIISVSETNPSDETPRQAQLFVKTRYLSKSISVIQNPSKSMPISINPTAFEMDAYGDTKVLTINVRGSWSISSNQHWCSTSTSNGTGPSEVEVIVEKNGTTEERVAILTITSKNESIMVSITQKPGYSNKPGGNDNPDPIY